MMGGCPKCTKIGGLILLVAGILFLGQDMGWWSFWTVNWYTAVFLILGLGKIAHSKCTDCQAIQSGKASAGKK